MDSALSALDGLYVGQLSPTERDLLDRAVGRGAAAWVYEGVGGFLGLAKVKLTRLPLPQDRPFYCIDAYGEVQHVEWIGDVGDPHGPHVMIRDSDGETFPAIDIDDWDDDQSALLKRVPHG